ncbi:hypothetical protein ACF0H5_016204 [Mactra antiquata]
MPCGRVVTQTRARRRQSDAKWRAGVAMCYSIMKNAVPNQKKLGRRKVSKALTIKETERHIINLEKKIKEVINERAPMLGKTVMMKTESNHIIPASLDDVRQDFTEKQHSLFICSSHSGRKRFTVPPDIESNLHQMRQLSSDVFVINEADYKMSKPQTITSKISPVIDNMPTVSTKQQNNTIKLSDSTQDNEDDVIHGTIVELLTPVKEEISKCGRNIFIEKEHYASTPLKAESQQETKTLSQSSMHLSEGFTPIKLPYGLERDDPMLLLPGTPAVSGVLTPSSDISVQNVSLVLFISDVLTSISDIAVQKVCVVLFISDVLTPISDISVQKVCLVLFISDVLTSISDIAVQKVSLVLFISDVLTSISDIAVQKVCVVLFISDVLTPISDISVQKVCLVLFISDVLTSISDIAVQKVCVVLFISDVLTQISDISVQKVSLVLFISDVLTSVSDISVQKVSFVLSVSDVLTPISDISVQKTPVTPGSGIMTIDYFGLDGDIDIQQGLFCTESIESVDFSHDLEQHSFIRDYEPEQTVPLSVVEDNCLDFDGYLLFHKHNSSLVDPGSNQTDKHFTTANMWEKLEPDYKASYAKMAALEQSEDSNDLSDDLLGIDLRPLHKEQHDTVPEVIALTNDVQEVPSLLFDLTDVDNKGQTTGLQFIEGFEDLGVFYQNQDEKIELSKEFNDPYTDWEGDSQVVPQI